MTHVAIAGASGVVGSRVLAHLLTREELTSVTALGRRPLEHPEHERLTSRVVDLGSRAEVAAALPPRVGMAFCCLGTTMRQAGSKEAFRAVDHDAVVGFAAGARDRGARHLPLVSSLGARADSRNFYLRTKGEAEEAVAGLGYPHVTILRPSLLDDQGARTEHRPGERWALLVAKAIFSVLGRTRRHAPIPADVVGRAMVRLAFEPVPEPVHIVESERLHGLGTPTPPEV